MVNSYLENGSRLFVKRNTVIYEQGTTGDGFYLVNEGKIKISMKVFNEKNRILEILGKGQLFGEQSLDQNSYFSTATALENSVVYYFTSKQFQDLVIKSKYFRNLFYSSMINKLKQLGAIIQLKSLSVEVQLANSLLELCHKYNSCEIPLNQQQLSNYTGLTRITIYKIVKEWKDLRLIIEKEGKLFIGNPKLLQEYVNTT
ncbi:MAG TPA: Crp/Fnr family transcriptional regulator [Sporosarcina psychrophila]|uniref:Crp/Fnr family transcriptional regulator n=1 Tax=Sporosarcina psychrophila TaxID=1476 RepID=A0A921FV35_SPOPS|nr:Crp/Fnr family transcriptional regulator [Sporosarcina psychrophila]